MELTEQEMLTVKYRDKTERISLKSWQKRMLSNVKYHGKYHRRGTAGDIFSVYGKK